MISRRGGQSSGIFGVRFLSLHQKTNKSTQQKKRNEKRKQQTLAKISSLDL
jgi:hypothetical protein